MTMNPPPQHLPITWPLHLLLQPHLSRVEAGGVAPDPVGQHGDVVDLCLHVVEQRGLDVLQGAGLAVPLLQVLYPLLQAVVPPSCLFMLQIGIQMGWEDALMASPSLCSPQPIAEPTTFLSPQAGCT